MKMLDVLGHQLLLLAGLIWIKVVLIGVVLIKDILDAILLLGLLVVLVLILLVLLLALTQQNVLPQYLTVVVEHVLELLTESHAVLEQELALLEVAFLIN